LQGHVAFGGLDKGAGGAIGVVLVVMGAIDMAMARMRVIVGRMRTRVGVVMCV